MRAVTGYGSVEERLRALETLANFHEYITPVSVVGGDAATPPLHALLSAVHTDTVANAVTQGSLIYGNTTPAWDELAIGGANALLQVTGGLPAWRTPTQVAGTLAHNDLSGLATGDPHTLYALLAGRTGTTNNLTLSTDADGTLTGSSGGSGFDLKLVSDGHSTGGVTSGSGAIAVGYVEPQQPLRLLSAGYTFDSDKLGFSPAFTDAENRALGIIAVGDGTITLSGTNPTFRVLTCNGTVSLTESAGSILAMGNLFNHQFTYTNAGAFNFGPVTTFVDQPTFSVDTTASARTQSLHVGVRSAPTMTRSAGANTNTLTAFRALWVAPTVNSNCTLTNAYGVYMHNVDGGGTVTNRYGLYIEDPVTATVTNDYVIGYNAAAGTHNCLASASSPGTNTVSTSGNVSPTGSNLVIRAWERRDVNGTLMWAPLFGV